MELFLLTFASLFSLMNPLGTVPIFVSLTQHDDAKERTRISILTAIDAAIILIVSFFIGNYLLFFFGININSLRIAGGLVIMSSGFALLTGSFNKHKGINKASTKKDMRVRDSISLTPLAIPMLAGPGTISVLIGMQNQYPSTIDKLIIVTAIIFVCLIIFIMLKGAHFIANYLGASGINAVSRIIGFIVIAIGVEFISTSIIVLLNQVI